MFFPEPSQLYPATFSDGFKASLTSLFYMLRHPSLLFYAFLSLFINGVILFAAFWYSSGLTEIILPSLKQYETVSFLLKFLLTGALAYFLLPLLFGILLNLNPLVAWIASLMFKRVFKLETGEELEDKEPFWISLPKTIVAELVKFLISLPLLFAAFVVNIIPAVGSALSLFLFTYTTVKFSGWAYVTPYYEALGYGYSQQAKAMKKQKSGILGVGLISIIPILNVFALLVGPVAGALLMAQSHKRTQKPLPDTQEKS